MAKIGRNEKCPCGSGAKYKHCCALRPQVAVERETQERQLKVTLTEAIEIIQRHANEKKAAFRELGVFLFYSTKEGDAWMLETTESDCVQLARCGELLTIPINENPETIEIDWSHTFTITNKQLMITAYDDKSITELTDAPCQEINAAVKRIRKKMSPEMVKQVHLSTN